MHELPGAEEAHPWDAEFALGSRCSFPCSELRVVSSLGLWPSLHALPGNQWKRFCLDRSALEREIREDPLMVSSLKRLNRRAPGGDKTMWHAGHS